MHKNLTLKSAGILLLLLVSFIIETRGQVFKDGVRQGLVKVKFSKTMSETVSRLQLPASGNITTGIQKFDAAAKSIQTKKLTRLFPFDAKHESKLRQHGLHLWYILEVDQNTNLQAAVLQLKQVPELEIVEVDREKTIAPYQVIEHVPGPGTFSTLPFNDPYLDNQWHYNNSGQSGFADADINLFEAWLSVTGSSDVVVSVHDEGVDVAHEDLKANIWVNQDEIPANNIDDDGNGYIDDINGFNFAKNRGAIDAQHHGTHVAGTIAAVNNNGKGVCGIAGGNGSGNGVKVMSLQILGGGLIERSYVYAANNGAVISQNSWGYTTEGYFDQSVLDAIKYFIAEAGNYEGSPMRGGIVLFATGNSNLDGYWYPARYEPILSVSAIGPEWKKAAYSNYGTWVEIAAPGGDQINYPGINGVLSTIPGNKYAYMQGTSMACPHVSGIAALVLANRSRQLTSDELWQSLVTGVVPIDESNEEHLGKLGSGAIDASLAIRVDEKISPATITDLAVEGIAQEFATLSWTVPPDEDDDRPVAFTVYHHVEPITVANLVMATKADVRNTQEAGTQFNFEVADLLGQTLYYFAITATDRWGNTSFLSNVTSASTDVGPSIAVSTEAIDLMIDASVSTSSTVAFDILNSGEGILRWESFMRHRIAATANNFSAIRYPVAPAHSDNQYNVAVQRIRATESLTAATTSSFEPVDKKLADFPTNIVGETDISLPNSAGARFYVSEDEGFNLTDVRMYLKHDPDLGPVVVEVYQGNAPVRSNLLHAQEYTSWTKNETWATVTLDEQIYFEQGTTFWVVFHVPAGNLYPFGIGYESQPENSTDCFFSFNVGATWQPLEEALNDKSFAWAMSAGSNNEFLGTYVALEPAHGDVAGNSEATVSLVADVSTLVNGTYSANMVIASNDPARRELRIPVSLSVSGHPANVKHIDVADFGAVFLGDSKTVDIVLDNEGFGAVSGLSFTIDGSDFEIESSPWSMPARQRQVVQVKFRPSLPGNKNAQLTFSDGAQTWSISLFGVGAETAHVTVSPEVQLVDSVAIGDNVAAAVTIRNDGAYPLRYFIPGFDTDGISENWPTSYHRYGYKVRSNREDEVDPLTYEFEDISNTGVDITSHLVTDEAYFAIDMGFSFPYYGQEMNTIFVSQKGFTTFDNAVAPINTPTLNNSYNPRGYISPLGTWLTYIAEGKIYYKRAADKLIIQYDHVTDGFAGYLTAQMVLYPNGDIRFYYDDLSYAEWALSYLNILIEDLDHSDGILIHDYQHPVALYNGLAIGIDYPGPDIITNVSNGAGILVPGDSSRIEVTMSTAGLSEGITKRYLNIITNDPTNKQKIALVALDIIEGGEANPVLSTTGIDFGNVFQGAEAVSTFTITNTGTAAADVASVTLQNGAFTITGPHPAAIRPGLFETYVVSMPTSVVTVLTDTLVISYTNGNRQTIVIDGAVVEPPAVSLNLSPITETLQHGQTKELALTIQNPGNAAMTFTAAGKPWLYFEAADSAWQTSYEVQKENTGGVYQWIDIRKTGTQLPFATNLNDEQEYWRTVSLPFAFEYFGKSYQQMKVGENGIISFEESPSSMLFTDQIPSDIQAGAHIMPYWTTASFNTFFYKPEDVGIFYKTYADRVIITWSHLVNFFGGMGDPVSAQVILYNNGMMRFQYKIEDSGIDLTSHSTLIGLQQDTHKAVVISHKLALDHGKGLVYNIHPLKQFNIPPGATINGKIVLDATNTYAGVHTSDLRISTNVPGSELLVKPVTLTIQGAAALSVPDSVKFGQKIIAQQNGMPVAYPHDVDIVNTGLAPVDVTWVETASGGMTPLGLQLYVLIDGWFGPQWEWVDAAVLFSPWNTSTPVLQLMPGDRLAARAVFYPSSTESFADEIVLTTSLGEKRIYLSGSGIEPPSLIMASDPVFVSMNTTTEITTRTISFSNDGSSPLTYDIKIDFDRTTSAQPNEAIGHSANSKVLATTVAEQGTGIRPSSIYNRVLRHTERESPDNFVGTDGAAPFTIATKFNAGNQGFNLSHVETYFRAESLTSGTIDVEVRAGASITESVTLSTTSVPFTASGNDQGGNWIQLALPEAVFIYPNEDFFVLITSPFEIHFPQGIVMDQSSTPGRYWYNDSGVWLDIQNESEFSTAGWLMYAAEISAQTSSWISISSSTTGSLDAGAGSMLALTFKGELASRGNQTASVVVTTNDPTAGTVTIPVKLHVNEAPQFISVPVDIAVGEMDTVTIEMAVTDPENQLITVRQDGRPSFVTTVFENNRLIFVLTPQYGDAGEFELLLTAEDEYGASRQLAVPVRVIHSNQPPVFVGEDVPLALHPDEAVAAYEIDAFFSDPDGDAFTFTVTSGASDVVEVFASHDKFLLMAKQAGQATLDFTVTDSHGDYTTKSVTVDVQPILATGEDLSGLVRVFPNPADDVLHVSFGNAWTNAKKVEIMDMHGRVISASQSGEREFLIDVSAIARGIYLVRTSEGSRIVLKKVLIK